MSLRAQNIDWRKKFQWALELETPFGPLNIAQIVKCNFPSVEVEKSMIKQAGALYDVKNPGRLKYDDLKCERILLSQTADLSVFNWLNQAANPTTGTGLRPSLIKRNAELVPLDDSGGMIERVKFYGCWPTKIEGDDFEGSSDAWLEKITFSFDYLVRTPI
jgi:phage tail-like protein